MSAARRFFVAGSTSPGACIEISGGDAHKIAHVLRLRKGDEITAIDSTGRKFSATLMKCGRIIRAQITEEIEQPQNGTTLRVDLAQAVPKGNRMDFVIEKATELGVAAFQPFFCERSIARTAGDAKRSRWQRLAKTAAQQCGSPDVPEVRSPVRFDALLRSFEEYDAVLLAWELAEPQSLTQRLSAILPSQGTVLVVVGPEGGFSHSEAEDAKEHCADLLWLGPRILRTDTAALVLLAVIGAITS